MKGIFFLLCKERGNLVFSTTKCATDIFYLGKICYQMEICQKRLLGDWTHVLEEIILTSGLMETCLSYLVGYKTGEEGKKGKEDRSLRSFESMNLCVYENMDLCVPFRA